MTKKNRLTALISTGVALAAMLALAASLSQLEFKPGTPFSLEAPAEEPFAPGGWNASLGLLLAARIALGLALLSIPLLLLYMLINRKARRYLPRVLLALAVTGGALMLGGYALERIAEGLTPGEAGAGGAPGLPGLPQAPAAEFEAAPPGWATTAAAIGLALALAGGIAMLLFRGRPAAPPPPTAVEQIAQNAEEAMRRLYAGGDLREAVIRCYAEMSAALDRERSIRRGESMTAREFERLLAAKGMPAGPARSLTGLFEAARYSPYAPGEAERQQALDSLGAILEACRRGK